MRASLERLLGRPVDFPAEITLSSGEKYVLPHPDHAHMTGGGIFEMIMPEQIAKIRAKVKKSAA